MKTFVVLVLTVIALFVWQRGNNSGTSVPNSSTKLVVAPASVPPSGRNWAKNSLDRTHEAIEQVSRMREEQGRP
jgi:hypothetical protein